jgi:galactokinase
MCDLVRDRPGVHGERMIGGGDCGTSGAIVLLGAAASVRAHVECEYPRLQPAFATSFATHECRMADGLTLLPLW